MSLKCPVCASELSLNLAVGAQSGVHSEPQNSTSKVEVVPQIAVARISSRARFKYEDPNFQAFWKVYPRRLGKASAFALWLRITVEIEPQIIIEAASQYAAVVEAQKLDLKFVPYPATWLNAGRWDDEIPPDPAELADRRAQAEMERTRREHLS